MKTFKKKALYIAQLQKICMEKTFHLVKFRMICNLRLKEVNLSLCSLIFNTRKKFRSFVNQDFQGGNILAI